MDTEQKRKVKKLIFGIIIIGVFFYLALYIYQTATSIYYDSKDTAEKITKESLDCAVFSIAIIADQTKYENNELEFVIQNKIGESFEYLIVKNGAFEYEFELADFSRNSPPQKIIIEDIQIEDIIRVFPKGCKDNYKEIKI